MKKITLFLFLLVSYFSFAQYATNAPWMEKLESAKSNNEEPKFKEIVEAFNNYWEGKDHKVKGSGYKPFMRWQYHWQNYLKDDGSLLTPQEIWDLWQHKQSLRTSNEVNNAGDWEPIGPYAHTNTGSWSSGQGRVNVIEVDPNHPNVYYVGAPAGGIWKSVDSGENWEPLSDYLPQIGVSAIAVDPSNSNTIYLGTGDEDAADTYSIGILKSTDGGQSWSNTGLTFSNSYSFVSEIYVHPANPNIVFATTSSGFYKSEDAGASFVMTQSGSFRDLKLKPGDPSTVYAATGNRLYRSTDTANSFSMLSNGLPSSAGRQVLAVTPAAPDNVYILSASTNYNFQGVYKSTNNGTSFSRVDDGQDIFESSQAWFDIAFDVSKTNEDTMFVGVLDVWKTTNGGKSFTKWNNWDSPFGSTYTHADIHMIRYFGNELFFGTDGGIYRSSNGHTTTDLTQGLAIGQFYKIAVSKQSSDKITGGLQDNGGYALSDNSWKNYFGADGMDTAIDPANPDKYYGFIQNGGGLYYSNDAGASLAGSVAGPETGNWVTPLEMNAEGALFAGYSKIYELIGNSFIGVSNAFPDAIDCLEIDPTNSNNMFVAVEDKLYKSTDRGGSFVETYDFPNNVTSVAVNSTTNNIIYVTTSGNNGAVYKSVDAGLNFTNITYNLPNEPKLVVKHQAQHNDNPIFVGTILGVYRLDDTSTSWEIFGNNLPNVPVRDLEINLVDQNITAATYGRGIWQSNIPMQMADDDVDLVEFINPGETLSCENSLPAIVVRNNGYNTIESFEISYHVDGGFIHYYTWEGTLASEETTTVDLPVFPISRGYKALEVNLNLENDAYAINNQGTINFYKNDIGVAGNINSFEAATDKLIVIDPNPQSPLWERGIPSATVLNQTATGPRAYGTNMDGHYPNNHSSYLVSQCFDLTSIPSPILKFEMAYDLEDNYDVLYVEYSTNGTNWQLLGSTEDENWYNSNANCEACPGAQWTGTASNMQTYTFNLENFSTETNFMLRFVLKSDMSITREGAVIDDLVVTGANMDIAENMLDTAINVYPNPSEDIFTIEKSALFEKMDIQVLDITGKQIAAEKNISETYHLDLSSLSAGVYLLQIETAQGSTVKKLIKY